METEPFEDSPVEAIGGESVSLPEAIPRGEPGHTSRRIEDAALNLFFDRGFQVTTMREIAFACGLTAGALYNHFPSKDQLLYSIIYRVHDELEHDINSAVEAAGDDPRDQLRAYVYAHALFHTHSRKEARVANQEIQSLPEAERNAIIAMRRRMRAQFKQILEKGQAQALFDVPDFRVWANAIINMAIRIADWFDPEGPLGAETVSEQHAELALRMVAARR